MRIYRLLLFLTCVLGGLAVVFGAFGAHYLEEKLSNQHLETWHTAVQYQFIHVLLIFLISLLLKNYYRLANGIILLVLIGVLLFSGSLYLLALQSLLGVDLYIIGPLTPIGGVCLIVAWFWLALVVVKKI